MGDTLFELGPLDTGDTLRDEVIVGRSPALQKMLGQLRQVAPADLAVLLVGETGTGKELAALRIHELSAVKGPFLAVNCGAIPPQLVESSFFGHVRGAFTGAMEDRVGFFERAAGGTLFLDEIGAMPLDHQPKLLRAVDNREFLPVGGTTARRMEARILSATNIDLSEAVRAGTFRRDLYARLAEYVIEMPPLRRRRSDIPLLARHFLEAAGGDTVYEMSAGFLEDLLVYDWPMNVRELRTIMHRLALIEGSTVRLDRAALREALQDLVVAGGSPLPVAATNGTGRPGARGNGRSLAPPREELVLQLQHYRGNVTRVAVHYGKGTRQVYRWLERYGIDLDAYRL
jgi:transcriptional regulator with GAF, ATPase, and Fis domain